MRLYRELERAGRMLRFLWLIHPGECPAPLETRVYLAAVLGECALSFACARAPQETWGECELVSG